MKFLILSLTLSLNLPLGAFAKGIGCQPNPHQSQFLITWDEQNVVLHVETPMGYTFMPQMETVGESSISFLKMQSADLKGLGDLFQYKWDRKSCTISDTDEWMIQCYGKVKSSRGDNDVPSLGFTTAKIEENSLSGKFETYRVRIIFDKDNTYFVTIPVAMNFCRKF